MKLTTDITRTLNNYIHQCLPLSLSFRCKFSVKQMMGVINSVVYMYDVKWIEKETPKRIRLLIQYHRLFFQPLFTKSNISLNVLIIFIKLKL